MSEQKEEALYEALFDHFPTQRSNGRLDARALAADLNVSYQAVYKWFERGLLPAIAAVRLIRLSRQIQPWNRLTLDDVIDCIAD